MMGAAKPNLTGAASGRLGGMEADFVGTLGRKAGDVRTALGALEADPKARGPRDDVRRRLHAIGTAARLLHFDSTRVAIARAESILDRMGPNGALSQGDLDEIGRLLDDLPVLAWEDVSSRRAADEGGAPSPAETPHTALVVGEDAIAMAISEATGSKASFECERTTDATYAAVLTQEMNPDVVVVDGDIEGADELVETLLERAELLPIVVLGRFEEASEEARFIALGVAKTLKKPAGEEALFAACLEAADQHRGRTVKITLPEPVAKAEKPAQTTGAEAASEAGADRAFSRGRGAAADVRLDGRRVLVADDDPGVTWFIADLLRTTGCVVSEARNGDEALELAYKTAPHLILSDVLMPKLDGFQLTRLLARDVALRDTPVILLSWKEDMLQRVRELGAGAAGYLRKESDARAILARVREALWPRARIEARLRGRQEVRGRLDGLTVRSLLELVCSTRPKSHVCLRDASFVYELEIRDGVPCRAWRTAPDGTVLRGSRALAAMLGVWAGRFHVSPSEEPLEPELLGSLRAQIAEPIACARGAAQLLSGARILSVTKVTVDSEIISGYLGATPEPVRRLVERVSAGESPRQVMLRGNVDPVLLESALLDVASRGAVREVRGVQGEDLLRPAVDRALRMESGEKLETRSAEAEAGVEVDVSPEPVPAAEPEPSSSNVALIESMGAGSVTPMTSVAVKPVPARNPAPPKKRERRWFSMGLFSVVAVAALAARLATGAPAPAHAAAAAGAVPAPAFDSRDEVTEQPEVAPAPVVSAAATQPASARSKGKEPTAKEGPAKEASAKDAGVKAVAASRGPMTDMDLAATELLHAPNASTIEP
ncbi:response regulator [Pendulispora brunnea]|uniref:Response regulator n=1 Tax=Pendulispora brunnea TaxID=2905690 RepID=A0ABZ2K992_9BACT